MTQAAKSYVSADITASGLTGSFVTAITATAEVRCVIISSTSDAAFRVTFDDGNASIRLPANQGIILDLASDKLPPTSRIQLKHDGAAPTSGVISILLMQAPS